MVTLRSRRFFCQSTHGSETKTNIATRLYRRFGSGSEATGVTAEIGNIENISALFLLRGVAAKRRSAAVQYFAAQRFMLLLCHKTRVFYALDFRRHRCHRCAAVAPLAYRILWNRSYRPKTAVVAQLTDRWSLTHMGEGPKVTMVITRTSSSVWILRPPVD